jgi:hypothetical protein
MRMAQTLTLETTIVQQETGRVAHFLFVPEPVLARASVPLEPIAVAEAIGVQLGSRVLDRDQAIDGVYAALWGRTDAFSVSFPLWRQRRTAAPNSPESVFAAQLVTDDLVPVSSSPIRGASLGDLVGQGAAWIVTGFGFAHSIADGIEMLVLTEFGFIVFATGRGIARAFGDKAYGITSYYLDRLTERYLHIAPTRPVEIPPPDDQNDGTNPDED